jgi:NO-binding membrane sensor protein with MHYT domain
MQFRALIVLAVVVSLFTMYATIAGFMNAQSALMSQEQAWVIDVGARPSS